MGDLGAAVLLPPRHARLGTVACLGTVALAAVGLDKFHQRRRLEDLEGEAGRSGSESPVSLNGARGIASTLGFMLAKPGMQDFLPQQILIEAAVETTPVARRILAAFPQIPRRGVARLQDWKEPGPITPAKRILAIAEHKGEALKPFPKVKHAINLGDFVFNPVSNCHLECTYCI